MRDLKILNWIKGFIEKATDQIFEKRLWYDQAQNTIRHATYNGQTFMADTNYQTCSLSMWKSIIKLMPIKNREYTQNKYDCDDYAHGFFTFIRFIAPKAAVGIVWIKGHAFNFIIDDRQDLYWVEPQSNKIWKSRRREVRLMVM